MQKLLVVSTWLPYPPDNGSRMRAHALLRHLATRYDVTLVALGAPALPDALEPLRAICAEVHAPGALLPPRRLGWRGLLSGTPRHLVQMEAGVSDALIAAHAPRHHAVLALQLEAAYRVLPVTTAAPTVFDEAELGIPWDRYARASTLPSKARAGLTWLKLARFVRTLVRRFGRTTVVSADERAHLLRIGCEPQRIALVPNGIDLVSRPVTTGRAHRVIYPGAVTFHANFDAVQHFVKDIFPLLRRERPTIEFWVTGATEGRDVAPLARVEGVRFTGHVADVTPLIAESAACVVPLRVGGGTRLKVLQAMAVGTPVVSTAKGVEGLSLEAGRDLLVADTPQAFAEATVRVAGDRHLSDRLVASARATVASTYDWRQVVGALDDAIHAAVADFANSRDRIHPH